MWLKFFFIRSTGRGRKRPPKYRYNTPPKGTQAFPLIKYAGRDFFNINVVVFIRTNHGDLYIHIINTGCCYFPSRNFPSVWRGSHIFSHISWTTSPISNILDILKSWRIDLKAKKKSIELETRKCKKNGSKKSKKTRYNTPPKGTQRQFKTQEL